VVKSQAIDIVAIIWVPIAGVQKTTIRTFTVEGEEKNERILLVILFPRDTAAVTALDPSDFWAFNEGMSAA
jgi:hypothetical protein